MNLFTIIGLVLLVIFLGGFIIDVLWNVFLVLLLVAGIVWAWRYIQKAR